jgi:hypothetical protein
MERMKKEQVKGAKTLRDKVNLKQIPWNQIHVMKN